MIVNPNRAVAVLTPLVFAPAAGFISALAAKYGLDVDGGSLQAIFITGATIALAKSVQWMKGWQDHEKREAAAAEQSGGGESFAQDAEDLAGSDVADDLTTEDEFDLSADEETETMALTASEG